MLSVAIAAAMRVESWVTLLRFSPCFPRPELFWLMILNASYTWLEVAPEMIATSFWISLNSPVIRPRRARIWFEVPSMALPSGPITAKACEVKMLASATCLLNSPVCWDRACRGPVIEPTAAATPLKIACRPMAARPI